MAKAKATVFFCQNCGYESAKWMGQCPACREWNTFVEEPTAASSSAKSGSKPTAGVVQWGSLGLDEKDGSAGSGKVGKGRSKKALPLKDIDVSDADRMSTGIAEMDRVLGGGIVQGSLILVGGDPGIGKSTLLLQVCRNLTNRKPAEELQQGSDGKQGGIKVLYVSGEESQQQIKLRANRMGAFGDSLLLLCETNLGDVQEAIVSLQPQVVIIDSIQTMYSEAVSSAPGSVSQVRETTGVLLHDLHSRPCHKGRSCRRAESAGAHGGYRALLRRRPACQLPDLARSQEPVRLNR